jgi:hypothetical protein
MPITTGRWEGRIKIPTGGWSISVTDSGGTSAISLTAANTYYLSSAGNDTVDLLARLQATLNADATLAGTYSVSIAATEGGTGLVTISATGGGNISVTWTSTDLRDLLGFTGNLSGATSHVGTRQARSLWLPGCPADTPYGLASDGIKRRDGSIALAPDGTYKSIMYSSHTVNEYVYSHVVRSRCIQASESTVNESFERWWHDTIAGDAAWAEPGCEMRWYKDAGDDATYKTFNALEVTTPPYERAMGEFDGWWKVRLAVVLDV